MQCSSCPVWALQHIIHVYVCLYRGCSTQTGQQCSAHAVLSGYCNILYMCISIQRLQYPDRTAMQCSSCPVWALQHNIIHVYIYTEVAVPRQDSNAVLMQCSCSAHAVLSGYCNILYMCISIQRLQYPDRTAMQCSSCPVWALQHNIIHVYIYTEVAVPRQDSNAVLMLSCLGTAT